MGRRHHGHHHYGHHGYGHGGFRRWRWLHPHRYEPLGADADDDGDDAPPPPFPVPPLPPMFPGADEMETEAERHGQRRYRRHGYVDDQEMSLNDAPPEARGRETNGFRHSGRWVLSEGKLILIGV
jgi:hypothetical protein